MYVRNTKQASTGSSLTRFTVAPVVSVLGETAEEEVQNKQDDGKHSTDAERGVK